MMLKKKLWIGIILLILLTPVGIMLPLVFDGGDAWGEWSAETVEKLVGFIPEKLQLNSELWHAPIQDYNLGSEESPLNFQILSYVLSAIVGVGLIAALTLVIKRIIRV